MYAGANAGAVAACLLIKTATSATFVVMIQGSSCLYADPKYNAPPWKQGNDCVIATKRPAQAKHSRTCCVCCYLFQLLPLYFSFQVFWTSIAQAILQSGFFCWWNHNILIRSRCLCWILLATEQWPGKNGTFIIILQLKKRVPCFLPDFVFNSQFFWLD